MRRTEYLMQHDKEVDYTVLTIYMILVKREL
jgi:hypothetical protein